MSYAKELGQLLAEELQELVLLDEMNLNEIRDLKTLKSHIKSASSKYGTKHPKYKALLKLHAKKEAAESRKAERMAHIKERQEHHARKHEYKRVKGSPNTWKHESGHTLTFGDDRSWNHVKAGKKRGVGGNATPLRDLQHHLRSLHEEVGPNGESLMEIRRLYNLRKNINTSLLSADPIVKQKAVRDLALERRKKNIEFGRLRNEDEEMNEAHSTLTDAKDVKPEERHPWHDEATKAGLEHKSTWKKGATTVHTYQPDHHWKSGVQLVTTTHKGRPDKHSWRGGAFHDGGTDLKSMHSHITKGVQHHDSLMAHHKAGPFAPDAKQY
jgi:hypothetical protein